MKHLLPLFLSLILLILLAFPLPYALAAASTMSLVGYLFPTQGVLLWLFLLPLFGNRPGTPQESWLILLSSSLLLALQFSAPQTSLRKTPLIGLYLIVSALSLVPNGVILAFNWLRSSLPLPVDPSLLAFNLNSALTADEFHPAWPVKSLILTALSICLSLKVGGLARRDSPLPFLAALFLGFLTSLIVGLLDFYGAVSLLSLRELDPIVNPGGEYLRLQSFFGHSGWYAEYLTMCAPLAMLLLLLRIDLRVRISLIVLTLLLGEFVLILTFQRGGWLSYPLTLLAIWAAVWIFVQSEKGEVLPGRALQKAGVKILLTAPITVLLSVIALKLFGSSLGIEDYAARFKDIAKASDRLGFVQAALDLWRLNPLFGYGSESFALQFDREFTQPDGSYFQKLTLPLHGSAHGLYTQTLAGKGLIGLASLLLLLIFPIYRGVKLALTTADRKKLIVTLSCSGALIAVFIYGFVQEFFYVFALQNIFFVFVIVLLSTLSTSEDSHFKTSPYLPAVIFALFLLHVLTFQRRSYPDEYGCYKQEMHNKTIFQWCGVRSEKFIETANPQYSSIEIAPAVKGEHLLVLESCGIKVFEAVLRAGERRKVSLPDFSCDDAPPGYTRVTARFGGYMVPALEEPVSQDRRVLSFRWIQPSP
jgi:O-antigen ligase